MFLKVEYCFGCILLFIKKVGDFKLKKENHNIQLMKDLNSERLSVRPL